MRHARRLPGTVAIPLIAGTLLGVAFVIALLLLLQ